MEPDGFKSPTAQRRSWRIQRVAWVVLWTVLLVALAGGLGMGPLSRARSRSADDRLVVQYSRIWRVNSPEVLELRLRGDSSRLALELDDRLLDRVTLERVTPAPSETLVAPEGQRLVFAVSGEPAPVRLEVTPRRMGRLRFRLGVSGAQPLDLGVWVLP